MFKDQYRASVDQIPMNEVLMSQLLEKARECDRKRINQGVGTVRQIRIQRLSYAAAAAVVLTVTAAVGPEVLDRIDRPVVPEEHPIVIPQSTDEPEASLEPRTPEETGQEPAADPGYAHESSQAAEDSQMKKPDDGAEAGSTRRNKATAKAEKTKKATAKPTVKAGAAATARPTAKPTQKASVKPASEPVPEPIPSSAPASSMAFSATLPENAQEARKEASDKVANEAAVNDMANVTAAEHNGLTYSTGADTDEMIMKDMSGGGQETQAPAFSAVSGAGGGGGGGASGGSSSAGAVKAETKKHWNAQEYWAYLGVDLAEKLRTAAGMKIIDAPFYPVYDSEGVLVRDAYTFTCRGNGGSLTVTVAKLEAKRLWQAARSRGGEQTESSGAKMILTEDGANGSGAVLTKDGIYIGMNGDGIDKAQIGEILKLFGR